MDTATIRWQQRLADLDPIERLDHVVGTPLAHDASRAAAAYTRLHELDAARGRSRTAAYYLVEDARHLSNEVTQHVDGLPGGVLAARELARRIEGLRRDVRQLAGRLS